MIQTRQPVSSHDVGRHYDDLDVFYRELWGDNLHHGLWITGKESVGQATQQMTQRVIEYTEPDKDAEVCDVGCGYGAMAHLLHRQYGARVVGLTVSSAQQAYAQRRFGGSEGPTFLLQDWQENTLPDNSFDAVIAVESLAHMTNKQQAIDEAFRVLKPGGRFVFCVWASADDPPPWAVRYLLEPICAEGRIPGLPTLPEYREFARQAGFILARFEDLSEQVRPTWVVCIRRLLSGLLRKSLYRSFLRNPREPNRWFALTLPRLWLGYRVGAVRYGLYVARKPAESTAAGRS